MPNADLDLEELYRDYFPKLYSFFFFKLLHRENAEDLAAQTFLKVVEHLHTFEPGRAKIGTWIWRIGENTLIDFYRTRKTTVPIDAGNAGAALSVSFEEQYEQIAGPAREALGAALRRLPERDRVLIYRKYCLGESYHELSRRYGINESTLATILQRSKARLRRALGQLY